MDADPLQSPRPTDKPTQFPEDPHRGLGRVRPVVHVLAEEIVQNECC
jgi:hypothetical protein